LSRIIFGETEINQLHISDVIFALQQKVLGLDVPKANRTTLIKGSTAATHLPVRNVVLVQVLQGREALLHDHRCVLLAQRLPLDDVVKELPSLTIPS